MSKKKKILTGSALAVAALLTGTSLMGMASPGGGMGGGRPGDQAGASAVRTVALEKGELRSAVSVTGTVYSTDTTEVYSDLSYSVRRVAVSVGDTVEAGGLLAQLDTSGLELDISQKQASVSAAQATANQNLTSAQEDLNTYQDNLDNNHNSDVTNAESSVTSAEIEYQSALLDVESAGANLGAARRKYHEAVYGTDDDDDDDEEINVTGNFTTETSSSEKRTLQDDITQKEITYEKAIASLEKAEANLDKAKNSLDAANVSSGNTVTTYENKVKSAQLATNYSDQYIAIQKLQDDLAKCTVTAPVSGTVTAVNAVEGGSGSGLLFVIQNTDQLKILTNIKEYDISSVQVGDKVIIKSDATGDAEFAGTLSKIAPTSTLTASGTAASSTDAEYEAEVTVDAGVSGLRIGMNTRLSIVTQEKTGVFSVPFEAVDTIDGQSYIYVQEASEGGEAGYRRLQVETGLETNLYVEINGDGLEEGMQVVKNASALDSSQLQSNSPGGRGKDGKTPPQSEAAADQARENPGSQSGEENQP